MEFFTYGNGSLHGGRIAGVLYILALTPWYGREPSPMFLARVGFGVGWWLTFCDKNSLRFSELLDARHISGLVMTASGLVAQFLLLGNG